MMLTREICLSSFLAVALVLLGDDEADAFQPCALSCRNSAGTSRRSQTRLYMTKEDAEDDDIDVDSLGDWRAFRRNLAGSASKTVSKENEELLMKQNKQLGHEYKSGIWAHETSTPEVGGLVCRLPLEAEMYRNYRHNMIGQMLHKKLDTQPPASSSNKTPPRPSAFFEDAENDEDYVEPSSDTTPELETSKWYLAAQELVAEQMQAIADQAEDGAVDSSALAPESTEMLQLFLDHQENWQQVCLVLDRDETVGTATTLVLNRPMARKLSEDLAKLILYGLHSGNTKQDQVRVKTDLVKFMLAFGKDIAVYVGGPDMQDKPAILVHGIKDLPGAVEISPGSNIYRGGIEAAIAGVLDGKYSPLDFRFFVGRHRYTESHLDVAVVLGKYQPVACARSLSLKQCISLPKPLWHEVLELCGGELKDVSDLEMMKRDDLQFQVVDDEDDIVDELDELSLFDDDEDDEIFLN